MQLFTKLGPANGGLRARKVAQDRFTVVVARETDVNVERAFHHEIPAFHVDDCRASRCGFCMFAVHFDGPDTFGRIVNDPAFTVVQEPADLDRPAARFGVFGVFKCP